MDGPSSVGCFCGPETKPYTPTHANSRSPIRYPTPDTAGEVKGKWVGVSPARFEGVSATDVDVFATVRGSPGEKVTVSFANPQMKVVDVSCTIGEGSRAKIAASGSCVSF